METPHEISDEKLAMRIAEYENMYGQIISRITTWRLIVQNSIVVAIGGVIYLESNPKLPIIFWIFLLFVNLWMIFASLLEEKRILLLGTHLAKRERSVLGSDGAKQMWHAKNFLTKHDTPPVSRYVQRIMTLAIPLISSGYVIYKICLS